MICPRCGKESPDGARFCAYCGATPGVRPASAPQAAGRPSTTGPQPVRRPPVAASAATSHSTPMILAAVALAVVLAGGTIAFVAMRRGAGRKNGAPSVAGQTQTPGSGTPLSAGGVPANPNVAFSGGFGAGLPGGPPIVAAGSGSGNATGGAVTPGTPAGSVAGGTTGPGGTAGAVQSGTPGSQPDAGAVNAGASGSAQPGSPVNSGPRIYAPPAEGVNAGNAGGRNPGAPLPSGNTGRVVTGPPLPAGGVRMPPTGQALPSNPTPQPAPAPAVPANPPQPQRVAPRPPQPDPRAVAERNMVAEYLRRLQIIQAQDNVLDQQIATLGGNMLGDAYGLQALAGTGGGNFAAGFQNIMQGFYRVARAKQGLGNAFANVNDPRTCAYIAARCPPVQPLHNMVLRYFQGWVRATNTLPAAMQRLDLGLVTRAEQDLNFAQQAGQAANGEEQRLRMQYNVPRQF